MGEQEAEALAVCVQLGMPEAVVLTRRALRAGGFRILSEMPLVPRIGEGVGRRHLFLSVWEQMISASNLGGEGLDLGDHLQCSVVVFEDAGGTWVAVADPAEGLEGWSRGGEARGALIAVLEAVAGSGAPA